MGLESGLLIKDLDAANPESTDKRRFGDDHLRLIKAVLKYQFVNVQAQLLPTDEEFNYLVGVTSSIQTQLDSKLESVSIDLTPYAQRAVRNVWGATQQHAPIALGNVSGIVNCNFALTTCYTLTLAGATTLTFSNLEEGQEVTLKVTQGSNPAAALTLPANCHFQYGIAPNYTQTQGKYDVLVGKVIDGNVIFGFVSEPGAV